MTSSRTQGFLFVSVAINALFTGLLLGGGSYYLGKHPTTTVASHEKNLPEESLSRLTAQDRGKVEATLDSIRKDMDDIHSQMEKMRGEGFRLLKKESFDEKAFIAQERHMYEQHAQLKNGITQSIASTAGQLSPEDRIIFADILSRPPFSPPHVLPANK